MHTSNPRELSDYAVEGGHVKRTVVVWEDLRYGLDFNECAPSEGDDDKPHMHPSGQGRCTSMNGRDVWTGRSRGFMARCK